MPVTIDIGGIDERHAGIERGVQRLLANRVIHLTPAGANGPGAEPNLADRPPCAPEHAVPHLPFPLSLCSAILAEAGAETIHRMTGPPEWVIRAPRGAEGPP
jgi:hypothetical protein